MQARTTDSHRRISIEQLENRVMLSAPTQWTSHGIGGGGAMFAPSFSPHNPQELFAMTDMSELFHSTDLGKSWDITPFTQFQGGRPSQVQFTNDPKILYNLDNKTYPLGDETFRPTKSTDGGATWNILSSFGSNGAYFIAADPASTQNLIVSDYGHLYFSNNGGASFTLKYTAVNSGAGLYVAGAFFDGANIYVGTTDGLLVSSNGGSSFAIASIGGIPAGQTMFSFAGAKQNGTTRFFCVTDGSGDVFPGVGAEDAADNYASVYSLDVGQANWSQKTAGIAFGDTVSFVSMARNNINIAYLAGTAGHAAPKIYKTTNGGSSWAQNLFATNNQNVKTGWQGQGGDSAWSFGEITMAFSVSPVDANVAAFTDFGYIHLTTDGGGTWQQAYVSQADENPAGANTPKNKPYHGIGLEPTSALWLDWTDANNPNRTFAGYTDITGFGSADGGQSWSFPNYGNFRLNTIYHVETHPTTGVVYAATSSVHDLYQSTYLIDAKIDGGTGRVIMSNDHGSTWSLLHDFGHPVIWTAIDPTNTNRMYASVVSSTGGGIFVTNNLNAGAASTWSKVTNPPRTEGHPFNLVVLKDGSLVATYSGRRATVAGTTKFTPSSGVFISPDQGMTWQDRTDTVLSGMKYWTKDITIDPNDASQNTWYASVRSGFGGTGNGMGGLYKTTNRGVSWTRIFTDEGVESATILPQSHEMFVATTGDGLWYSTNFDAANPTFTRTNYPFRQPERIFQNPFKPSEIWVASFGWGLASASTASGSGTISGNVYNDKNSSGAKDAGEIGVATWTIFLDANNNGAKDAGETSTTSNASGDYVFNGLTAGTYHVKVQLQSGYRKSQPAKGVAGYDVAINNNAATANFGVTTNLYLGGVVYNDVNSNGKKDAGENGIANTKIEIISGQTIIATRMTDANGAWQVQGLSAGTGEADIVIPAGYKATNPANGKYVGSMTSGEQNANLNFGLQKAAPAPAPVFSLTILAGAPSDSLLDELA